MLLFIKKLKLILCNFLVQTLQYFQKHTPFFAPENMKKTPLKVALNCPKIFISVLARLPKWPKNRNTVPPKAP